MYQQMSSERQQQASEESTMAQGNACNNLTADGKNGKQKGKREMTGLVADVLSSYKSKNKKQRVEHDPAAVNALTLLRSASVDDKSLGSETEEKSKRSAAEDVASSAGSELRDDSESKKSKDVNVGDFIDIEKAQYTFPERLMELLVSGNVKKAMWWLPGGEAFAVVPNTFYDVVLAKHFQGTKFESFTRKLNRWGFKRLSGQGVPKGTIAYYHKLFKKDQPDLMKKMRSGKSNQNSEAEAPFAGASLEDVFGSALDQSATRLPPYLAAHLRQADAANSLLAQQASLAGSNPAAENALKMQLLNFQQQQQAQQQQQQQAVPARITALQLLAHEQRLFALQLRAAQQTLQQPLAQQAAAQQKTPQEQLLQRQAELMAMEEIRAAQQAREAAAIAQAQLRARLLSQQQQQAVPQQQPSNPSAIPQQQPSNPSAMPVASAPASSASEHLRMLLLRRQLDQNHSGSGW